MLVAIVVVALIEVLACGFLVIVARTPNGGSLWNVLGIGSFRTYGAVMLNAGQYRTSTGTTVGECEGTGAYADLRVGADVTVIDGNITTIAVGYLTTARVSTPTCMLYFDLRKVPAGHDQYGIRVAGRPPYWYSEASMHQVKGIGY
jgi:hypothetical protein